jgi:hypothetical protein
LEELYASNRIRPDAGKLALAAFLFRSPEETLPFASREYGLPNGDEVDNDLF